MIMISEYHLMRMLELLTNKLEANYIFVLAYPLGLLTYWLKVIGDNDIYFRLSYKSR